MENVNIEYIKEDDHIITMAWGNAGSSEMHVENSIENKQEEVIEDNRKITREGDFILIGNKVTVNMSHHTLVSIEIYESSDGLKLFFRFYGCAGNECHTFGAADMTEAVEMRDQIIKIYNQFKN